MTGRRRPAVLLIALLLTAAASESDPPPPSAAEQLSALLDPVVEAAVSRVLDTRAAVQADSRIERLEQRLDGVLDEMTSLQTTVTSLQTTMTSLKTAVDALQQAAVDRSSQLEQKITCQSSPSPLPADQAPHQEPEVRACARSCLQLRNQGDAPQDGVYWFTGMPVPVLCDFSHDGGGWTLLLTAVSRPGWDHLSVLERNERSPSLIDNYSILRHGDTIRDLGTGSRFAYRIEAQAETGRRRWGGVWFAPRHYSFVDETGDQTQIRIVRKFNNWVYNDNGIEKRMPWLRDIDDFTVLTTTDRAPSARWGTLVLNKVQGNSWRHAPWISDGAQQSGTILYWVREEQM